MVTERRNRRAGPRWARSSGATLGCLPRSGGLGVRGGSRGRLARTDDRRPDPVRVDLRRQVADELLGQGRELVAVLDENLGRPLVGVIDDCSDLFVDGLRDLVRIVPLLADL